MARPLPLPFCLSCLLLVFRKQSPWGILILSLISMEGWQYTMCSRSICRKVLSIELDRNLKGVGFVAEKSRSPTHFSFSIRLLNLTLQLFRNLIDFHKNSKFFKGTSCDDYVLWAHKILNKGDHLTEMFKLKNSGNNPIKKIVET